MRLANLRFFAVTIVTAFTAAAVVSAPPVRALATSEYFTDEEIDFIREAQGISLRVPAIIQLANIRLVYLGMKEKTKEDKALEKRIAELHAELTGKTSSSKAPGQPPKGPSTLPPILGIPIPLPKKDSPEVEAVPYLTDLTRTELLRGYVEAVDEIKSDIDDAYREKQDVREALEKFAKFCESSNQLLRRFQSRDRTELEAMEEARSTTQEALEAAQDALKIVPRTEKVIRP